MKERLEIPIPPDIPSDKKAFEAVSYWVAEDEQFVGLQTSQWRGEPEVWGLLICDIAVHAANAYEQQGVGTFEEIFSKIVQAFNVEAADPTGEASGSIEK